MPNRLASETSPYLQQHAENPVDWYPWGPEALARAREDDKPIHLSIGYAACHWCHVMAHESFEDLPTALLMNDRFVNIKVDREERPDLDSIYMQAVQAMTGHGGWPMTVFLTPDGTPYFGGTYFPKEERHGMPSFTRVLTSVSDAYYGRKDDIARTTASVREMYASTSARPAASGALTADIFVRAAGMLRGEYDQAHGGFGRAPKFPPTMTLEWLLTRWARHGDESALEMARATFVRMARGGIFDQIGAGFSRYSVDAVWLVPHFEKMLYDNAQLVRLGVHLWQATRDEEIRRVTERTIEWVRREMTDDRGGFYSSFDADSEGHEGKFYVWSAADVRELAGDDAALALDYWGVSDGGNFEGANILNVPAEPAQVAARHRLRADQVEERLSRVRRVLYEARAKRVWPGRDEKVVASWNGMMIRALAEAALAFGSDDARALALKAGTFAFDVLVRDGRAYRSAKDGVAKTAGFLEDHASLGLAALALHTLTGDSAWLDRARRLGETTRAQFWDDAAEAFFDTARDQEALIVRPRDITDNATPSGTSLATEFMIRLGIVFGDADATRRATRILETVAEPMARYPLAFGHMLSAADLMLNGAIEVALVGDAAGRATLTAAVHEQYVPACVVLHGDGPASDLALLRDRVAIDGRVTAYVCRGYSCDVPTTDAATLREQLVSAARATR